MSNPKIEDVHLSDAFVSTYAGKQPRWGFDGLGWVIYLRTYARKKPGGSLEEWAETVRRFTNGNYRIEAKRLAEIGELTQERVDALNAEMERFYHLAFNLVITPPGRGVWIGGTEYEERSGDSSNNCWAVSMRPQPYLSGGEPKVSFAPCFTFDQAMKGGGVGINIQRKHVDLVPKVSNDVNLVVTCNAYHPDYQSELSASGVTQPTHSDDLCTTVNVEDSREGWVDALRQIVDAHYGGNRGARTYVIDVSHVRPRGSEIRGFGGTASGPAPLVRMLQRVNEILNENVGGFVSPVQWGDVIQLIGTCVVAGNVRRTALILIGDNADRAFVESKNYALPENAGASQWRWASNNSVDISADTSRETLRGLAANIYRNGEPGYVNIGLSQNFGRIVDGVQPGIDADVEGFNPCGEIPLPNASPCNLFEISLPRIHELIELGYEDESLYAEAASLGVRYAYRVTFRKYDWEATRDIVERHRRLGVGITGITDWVLLRFGAKAITGYRPDGDPIFHPDVTAKLDEMYAAAKMANADHARSLHAAPSIKLTTVKPSGTMSLLMGVSPGMHWHWAPYMIRRVRMSIDAPLVPILEDCGYFMDYAQIGNDTSGNPMYDYTTVVVEFPIAAPTAAHPDFQSAGDVPLREQAALQALLATHWSDNAVSATLSFHKAQPKPVYFEDGLPLLDRFGKPTVEIDIHDEERVIDEITDILDQYKGVVKSTSLLPYATDTYPQMPYEAISKERYDEMIARISAKPWERLSGTITADYIELDESTECVGGHCPIR